MSLSIRKETSSLAFGMVGRFGGSSAGFVVAALNAASAASRELVIRRVLSAGILCPRRSASRDVRSKLRTTLAAAPDRAHRPGVWAWGSNLRARDFGKRCRERQTQAVRRSVIGPFR